MINYDFYNYTGFQGVSKFFKLQFRLGLFFNFLVQSCKLLALFDHFLDGFLGQPVGTEL